LNGFFGLNEIEDWGCALGKNFRKRRLTDAGQFERGDAGAAFSSGGQFRDDLFSALRLLDQDELEIVAQRGFDSGDVFVRDADFVG
jgi:hypothetical protein